MEEQKTVLLSLEFDTEEGLKRAANFRSAIDADKEALAELNKVIKKNGEQSQEQLVQREKLQQSIQANTKARADELRSIDNYLKVSKTSTGSIKGMRAEVAFLTEKYTDLSKAERENVAVGGKLQAHIKSLNDELKKQEGAYGDNRRSVGGYLDAIRQAPGAMGKFKAGIDGIGLAVKANPLGLLMSILPLLVGLFKSSGDGADYFAKIMQQVNAVVQVGTKYAVQFGEYLVEVGGKAVEAFKNPKKILNDLVEFMKTNLINRFKAFAVILEGIKTMDFRKVTDGVIQMGTGVADATGKIGRVANAVSNGVNKLGADLNEATSAAGLLADRLDKLENAESKFAAASSKTRLEIQQLIAQSKNRTLTEKERLAILDKADKMEVALNKRAIQLAEERMKLIKEENKIKQSDEDEEIARVNEQQEKINELRGQSLVLQEKLQARKDALADAAVERQKKRDEKAAADAEKLRLKQEKEAADALKKEEEYKKLLAETGEKEYQNALKSLETYLKEQENTLRDAQTAEVEAAGGNKTKLEEINKRYAAAFAVIEEKRLEAQKVINTDYNKETIDQEAKLSEMRLKRAQEEQAKLIETEKKGAEERKTVKEAEYTAAVAFADAFNALGQMSASFSEELNGFAKATAIFQIGVSAAVSTIKTFEGAVQAGVDAGKLAGPLAPIVAPLVTGTYYAAGVAKIFETIGQVKGMLSSSAPKKPASKMAEGGLLDGPSHANGGITGTGRFANVEVEGGEAIITKRATAMFAPILSALNVAGGGKPLAPTRYAALGGLIGASATGSNAGQLFDYDKLANKMVNAIERMPAPVVGISDIKAASARKDQRTRRVTLGA